MKGWEKNIRRVIPYVPGEQPDQADIIKLNSNENPYPPSPMVQEVLKEYDTDALRFYPNQNLESLREQIASYTGLKKECVFAGVGSDDVLALAFMAFFNGKDPLLFPDITYSFYEVWANLFQIPYEMIPLDKEFRIDFSKYEKKNGGIIFPNPNAPTGIYKPLETIEKLLDTNQDSIVIVDEAYIDFAGASAIALLPKYENLLVVQTFSKSRSLAGTRIGYALGNETLITHMEEMKHSFNSFTLSTLAMEMGIASLKDEAYFKEYTSRIVETREWTKGELRELGFEFPDSQGNFLLATHHDYSAKELFMKLREEGIYVRYFERPRLDQYLRITIGTMEEMRIFVEKVSEILS